MARTYHLRLDEYDISENRYMELKYFCLQYEDKKRKCQDILHSSSGHSFEYAPPNNQNPSETERKAIKRAALLRDIELIEACAKEVQDGIWYYALIENCCKGRPYATIEPSSMPTAKREAFFTARKQFFALLDERQRMQYQ